MLIAPAGAASGRRTAGRSSHMEENPYQSPVHESADVSLIGRKPGLIKRLNTFIRRLSFLPPLPARCSFCRRPHNIAGPFAEGYKSVLICAECSTRCQALIAKERERLSPTGAPVVEMNRIQRPPESAANTGQPQSPPAADQPGG